MGMPGMNMGMPGMNMGMGMPGGMLPMGMTPMGMGMGMGMGMNMGGMRMMPPMPGMPPMSFMGQPPPPPPPDEDEQASKRQRVEESAALIPEQEFLNKFPGQEAYLRIAMPVAPSDQQQQPWNLNGQVEDVHLDPTCTVSQLKDALQQRVGVPAGKINLRHPAHGFLKDQLTLAFYNMGPYTPELQLLLRERGGRKK